MNCPRLTAETNEDQPRAGEYERAAPAPYAARPPGPADPPTTHPLHSRLTPRYVPPRPAHAPRRAPVAAPPLRLAPSELLRGPAGGALPVVGLWLVQAEPSVRLDALFATLAHFSGLLAGYGILVMLLAGGVGITPMRALFETLPGGPGDLTLLYRAGDAAQLVLREELEAIAAARGAALHYLLGPSDGPFDPLAPRALRNLVPDLADHDVYLCGPPGMSRAAAAAAEPGSHAPYANASSSAKSPSVRAIRPAARFSSR